MKKKLMGLGITIGLTSTLLVLGCSSEQASKTTAPQAVQVESIVIERGELPSYDEAIGTVRALQTAQVSAQTMGDVVRVNVREGDRVSRGQVLAVIDDSQTRAGLDRSTAMRNSAAQGAIAANADFALAESTLKRYQMLRERKSVSAHEFDEVQSRYEAAKARRDMAQAGVADADAAVAQARTAQGFTQVRAPFAGTVVAKFVEPGSLASPGSPLFTIEDDSNFRLEVSVDEGNMVEVRPGASLPVSIDAIPGTTMAARVVQILPSADAGSRSFLVKLQLPKKSELRSGLFGRARFSHGMRQGYLVPERAIVHRGSMEAVYAVGTDQIASLRYITLGRAISGGYEVLSGIEGGDRIVANPGTMELNGRKVEVR